MATKKKPSKKIPDKKRIERKPPEKIVPFKRKKEKKGPGGGR